MEGGGVAFYVCRSNENAVACDDAFDIPPTPGDTGIHCNEKEKFSMTAIQHEPTLPSACVRNIMITVATLWPRGITTDSSMR